MDDLDKKIIGILRKDSRTSPAAIAEKLGVARKTVYNRINKLNDDGTIKAYTILLAGKDARLRAGFINPLRYLSKHSAEDDLTKLGKELSKNLDVALAVRVANSILAVWEDGSFSPKSIKGVGKVEELDVKEVYKLL